MTTVHAETGAPYALPPGGGEPRSWFDDVVLVKASARAVGVFEAVIAQGNEPPLHVHSREDEWLYVLAGEATAHAAGENLGAPAGAFVFLPRGVAHTFTVESETARLLFVSAPGGFERMFELGPKTSEDAVRALGEYGVEVVGPHPRDTASGEPGRSPTQ